MVFYIFCFVQKNYFMWKSSWVHFWNWKICILGIWKKNKLTNCWSQLRWEKIDIATNNIVQLTAKTVSSEFLVRVLKYWIKYQYPHPFLSSVSISSSKQFSCLQSNFSTFHLKLIFFQIHIYCSIESHNSKLPGTYSTYD